jgi:hypothetical protein
MRCLFVHCSKASAPTGSGFCVQGVASVMTDEVKDSTVTTSAETVSVPVEAPSL